MVTRGEACKLEVRWAVTLPLLRTDDACPLDNCEDRWDTRPPPANASSAAATTKNDTTTYKKSELILTKRATAYNSFWRWWWWCSQLAPFLTDPPVWEIDGRTDGRTELRWLTRATAVSAVASKNGVYSSSRNPYRSYKNRLAVSNQPPIQVE